jgi:AcrR family transcriptional regulator
MSTWDELVLECTRMIAADGMAAFSLRKLADRVGIKAPSIYAHFGNKDALLAAARHSARSALSAALLAGPTSRSPRKRLIATSLGYLRFAQDQPHLFALLMAHTPSERSSLKEPPDPDSPYALLLTRVQDFLGPTHLQAEVLCLGLWSLVHGAAVLRQTHLDAFAPTIAGLVETNLEALLNGWCPQ